MRLTEYFEQSLRQKTTAGLEEVRTAVGLADAAAPALRGLANTRASCRTTVCIVKDYGLAITTGNSLTAGFAFETLRTALRDRGMALDDCRVGVVGAAGQHLQRTGAAHRWITQRT
jgi:hypothetical protein